MKNFKPLFILLLSLLGFSSFNAAKSQQVDVNFSMFYNDLSPHGRWIDNSSYGQVWAYNDPNFRPYYTDGHWEFTNYGWSWVSDFDWGWAPFHYGRWEHDPMYGWIWIPGYEWASAWVSWSQNDGYYGWAPLGYGIDINVSFGSIPYDRWTYVPRQYICSPQLRNYYVSPGRSNNYFRNSITINNIYTGRGGRFMMGPDRSDVERYTHNRIESRRIDNFGRPGNVASNQNRGGNRNDRDRQYERNNEDRRMPDNNRRVDNNLPRRNESNPQHNTQQQRDMEASRNRVLNPPVRSGNLPSTGQRGNRDVTPGNLPGGRQDNPRRDQPVMEQRRTPNPQPDNATRQSERRVFGERQTQGAGRQSTGQPNSNPERHDRSDNQNRGRRN